MTKKKKVIILVLLIVFIIISVLIGVKLYIDTQDRVFKKGNSDKEIFYAEEYPGMWDSNSEYYRATVWKVYDNGKVIQYDERSGGVTTEQKTWKH